MYDCSVASDSATPWTVAYQVPLFMEFFRQEHGSRLPFPSPGDLSISGIEPGAPALQTDSLPSEPTGSTKLSRGFYLSYISSFSEAQCRRN